MSKPAFVSISEFSRISSLSKRTVYNEVYRGNIPKPVRLTQNRVAFRAADVEAWLASREETLVLEGEE